MTRATYRRNKWRDMAIDLKIGQQVRLHELSDVTSLCNAIRKRGDKASYTRDRHGFKVVKVDKDTQDYVTAIGKYFAKGSSE